MVGELCKRVLSKLGALATTLASRPRLQQLVFNAVRLNRPEFERLWRREEIRFLAYAFAHRQSSRSQILQDLWVCFELGEKRNGYFVEFGATNGLTNSNTWLLETCLGWQGILAEPNPFWHAALVANRRAAIDQRCVYSRTGDVVDFITTDNSDPELSALAAVARRDHFARFRDKGTRIQVETVSLNDLLAERGAPSEIDYLSVDTEGSEYDILSALDFDRYAIKLISVEQSPKTEREIQRLLERKGYVRVFRHFSQWDAWYVAPYLRSNVVPEIYAPTG
jgi:FkbM family methyltransferase